MAGRQLTVFWLAVAAYLAMVVGIGLWSYRRTRGEEGFLVAGRSLGPVIGGATLMANQVSAGATIGIVGFHYYSGFSYAWSWPLTWIGWMVCALFVAPKIRRHQGFTLPDFFAARYESRAACLAATSTALSDNADFDYPTLYAQCQPAKAPAAERAPRRIPNGARQFPEVTERHFSIPLT